MCSFTLPTDDEIQKRIAFIESKVKEFNMKLKSGSGLSLLIDHARRSIGNKEVNMNEAYARSGLDLLWNSLCTLDEHNVECKQQFKNLKQGNIRWSESDDLSIANQSADTNTPATDLKKQHFYKDFEFELKVAALYAGDGKTVSLDQESDPATDLFVDGIPFQCKHPSNVTRLPGVVEKYSEAWAAQGRHGVLAIGMEDILPEEIPKLSSWEQDKDHVRKRTDILAKIVREHIDEPIRRHKYIAGVLLVVTIAIKRTDLVPDATVLRFVRNACAWNYNGGHYPKEVSERVAAVLRTADSTPFDTTQWKQFR